MWYSQANTTFGLTYVPLFQTERAFQHQPTINLNKKGQKGGKALRYHRNVGLGFKTPREVSS